MIDIIKGTIGLNSHLLFDGKTIGEIMNAVKSVEKETNMSCSTFIIHTLKFCDHMPSVDKLFLFAKAFNVDPRWFLQPRDDKLINRFLSLAAEKRHNIIAILRSEGYNI